MRNLKISTKQFTDSSERQMPQSRTLARYLLQRVTFKYDGPTIVPGAQGADYGEFRNACTDDLRLYAYIRFTTGDAMSKRTKFAFITWIGENVGGLQRAKIGTDKSLVKDVVQNFAKELMITDPKELDEEFIRNELKKAGGANYDAQNE